MDAQLENDAQARERGNRTISGRPRVPTVPLRGKQTKNRWEYDVLGPRKDSNSLAVIRALTVASQE